MRLEPGRLLFRKLLLVTITRKQVVYYRPQTKLREGNVFTGVCDSVHQGMPASGRLFAPGRDVCSRRSAWFRGVPGGDPPGTAAAAEGTHPSGMHSCCI